MTGHPSETHDHRHDDGCGHTSITHEGHTDYLHGGHLHHPHEDHVDEHVVADARGNVATCTPEHACAGHDGGHTHGGACGHEAVPHAEHTDYLVEGHLHHAHGEHCDDHGVLQAA